MHRNVALFKLYNLVIFTPVMIPVIVAFWQDNGLSLFDVFVLQSIFAVAVVLLEVPTGMVADRMGKRASLVAAALTIGFGCVLYSLGHGFFAFLAAEVVLAIGLALYSGADAALLFDTLKALGRQDEYPKHVGQGRAIQMLSFAVSNLLGGFIATYSLRATVVATAVGPFLALFVALRMTDVVTPGEGDASSYRGLVRQSIKFVWRHRLVQWRMAFLAVLSGSSMWLLWLYQPYFEHTGVPLWSWGLVFALFNLWAAGASSLSHRFEDVFGRFSMLALMALHTLPLIGLALVMTPFSFLFILGHQTTRGLARPIISARILEQTYADKRSTVLSLSSMAGRLFFAVTGPVVGWLAQTLSMRDSLLAQLGLIGAFFVLLAVARSLIPAKYFVVKDSVTDRQ